MPTETADPDPNRTLNIHEDLATIADAIPPDTPAAAAFGRLVDRLARTTWSETERTSLRNAAIRRINHTREVR